MLVPFFQQILDRILPPRCTGCRAADALFCDRCWERVKWIEPPICRHCGRGMPQETVICGQCYHAPTSLQFIRAAVWFGRPVRRVIYALKYNGRTTVTPPLAGIMASSWKMWALDVDLVMPVPLHPDRERERGFNQSALLAEQFATAVGLPTESSGIFRVRPTEQQAKLNRQARISNVAGAFVADPVHVQGKRVLLVDDVITTGATLEAAAASVLAAGATSVSAYCLARARGRTTTKHPPDKK